MAHRAAHGLKGGLDNVMRVAARQLAHMQRELGIARKGIEELDGQLGIKAAHALGRHGQLAIGLPATRDIHGGHHECLVHGDRRVGKARNARLVAQSLAKRLAQHNARVLNGVVRVDLDVAHRMHRQIEQAMAAKSVEHVVEKRYAGRDIAHTGSIQVELDDNVGLARLAGHLGIAVHLHLLLHQRGKRCQHLVVFLRGTHGNAQTVRKPRRVAKVAHQN